MNNNINLDISKNNSINMEITGSKDINLGVENSQISVNYPSLANKPQINGVTLVGNKLDYELYLQHIMDEITPQDIDNIIYG